MIRLLDLYYCYLRSEGYQVSLGALFEVGGATWASEAHSVSARLCTEHEQLAQNSRFIVLGPFELAVEAYAIRFLKYGGGATDDSFPVATYTTSNSYKS